MRLTPCLAAALAAASLALGCSGHAGGGGGDPLPTPTADPLGPGERLSEVNDPKNPRPGAADILSITGVVITAKDTYDETADGKSSGDMFVQDAVDDAPPFSGITVYAPTFSPPDLKVFPGDVVDLSSVYQEFPGPSTVPFPGCDATHLLPPTCETLPELASGTVFFRYEWSGVKPRKIELKDLLDYSLGRQWLGMLVTIENPTLSGDGSGSSRYSATLDVGVGVSAAKVPTVTNALFPLQSSGVPMTAGKTFKSITGIVQYFIGFSIAPRSAEDLVQ